MTSIQDFKNEEGKVDWDALYKAEVAAGERCSRCGVWIFPAKRPGPTLCRDCEMLNTDLGEVSHEKLLRCPHCRDVSAIDWELGIFSEGTHTVYCMACDQEFEIETEVTYVFTSPAVSVYADED